MARSAYIGLAGPLGYDYKNPAPRINELDRSSPNPVLENVLGLLLCYEEIHFLAPQFCPADMRDLPYVNFVLDDAELAPRALDALAAFDGHEHQPWDTHPEFDRWIEVSEMMRGRGRSDLFAIDNHTHTVHLASDHPAVGNAMRLDNAFRDLWVISELGLNDVDVVFSSPAQHAMNTELESELADSYYSSHNKVEATQRLALCVPNFLGPRGSYHEALEQLRERPDVREFREFLSTLDASAADGITLAKSISDTAFKHIDAIAGRYFKEQHWFQSLGIPALAGVLNAVVPMSGTATTTAMRLPLHFRERRFKSETRWAPFVVNLHGSHQAD